MEPCRGMAGRSHASRYSCPAFSLTLSRLIPSSFLGLNSCLCFVTPQSASTAKGPKETPSSGGFDDSTLPLVDKSLGEHKQGRGT